MKFPSYFRRLSNNLIVGPSNRKNYVLNLSSFSIDARTMPEKWPLASILVPDNIVDQSSSLIPTQSSSQIQNPNDGTLSRKPHRLSYRARFWKFRSLHS